MPWEVVLERESLGPGNSLGVASLLPLLLVFGTNIALGII